MASHKRRDRDDDDSLAPVGKRTRGNAHSSVSETASVGTVMSLQAPEVAGLPLSSVIQVICMSAAPSYVSPWQVMPQEGGSGSGFVIQGRRILTNAHVVQDYITVRVKKFGNATKFPARVLSIGYDCDIALLTVDDDNFWNDLQFVTFEDITPNLYDTVSVIGYPTGGKTICVTKGVVSRVDTMQYNQQSNSAALVVVQIDAAINPGNSGGPAFDEKGAVVGIAFLKQIGGNADNIGYIIPVSVVMNFLHNVATNNGKYTGLNQLGFHYSTMENDTLRLSMAMPPDATGILIREVAPLGAASAVLMPNDIIMKIDGKAVANDGSVPFRQHEMINFEHLVTGKKEGHTSFEILRGAHVVHVEVVMGPIPALAPCYHGFDATPTYAIFGGFVFAPYSIPLVEEFLVDLVSSRDTVSIPDSVMQKGAEFKKTHDQEIVLLLRQLSHDINYGYDVDDAMPLKAFNGVAIKNMKQLVGLVRSSTDQFLSFEFEKNKRIVLDRRATFEAEKEILSIHGIEHAYSRNLRDVTDVEME